MRIPTISEYQVINMLQAGMAIAKHVYPNSSDSLKTITAVMQQVTLTLLRPDGDGVSRYETAGIEYASIDGNVAILRVIDVTTSVEDGTLDFDLGLDATSSTNQDGYFTTHGLDTTYQIRIELTGHEPGVDVTGVISEHIKDITEQINQKILEVFYTLNESRCPITTVQHHKQKFKPIVI